MFVRFGGCDYRCSWCDSMYAVDPGQVRENAEKLTVAEIDSRLRQLAGIPEEARRGLWVTLSGGNPALMKFEIDGRQNDLVTYLQHSRFKVSVETQGSVWRDWLALVDHLTVSPKPPSSGMASPQHAAQTARFLIKAEKKNMGERSIKVVVFNEEDLAWARELVQIHGERWWTFLSVGTDQDALQDEYRIHAGISDRYRWLCEQVAGDPVFRRTKVIPQLHVLAWGMRRGV